MLWAAASHVTSLCYVLVTCMVYTWCAKHKNTILQRTLSTSSCYTAWQSLTVGTLTRAARASASTTGWGCSNPYLVANTRLAPINSGTASCMHRNKHGIAIVCTLMRKDGCRLPGMVIKKMPVAHAEVGSCCDFTSRCHACMLTESGQNNLLVLNAQVKA